jgi:NADH:ubiquinone oxidoreductase subunit 3 (subunit A)
MRLQRLRRCADEVRRRFYLVSILFIIFDLEIAFLFPWAAAFGDVGMAASGR